MKVHWTTLKKFLSPALMLLCLSVGIFIGWSRGIPFVMTQGEYSIGIYTGKSSFKLKPPPEIINPVLTAKDVTDVPAIFTADPFMVNEKGIWYMFFEVLNARNNQGDIGLAVSNDGFNWSYKQIVLDEPYHLSYPYVFKWKDDYYMIPESCKAYSVKLYKATSFPTKWTFVKNLFSGNYFDSSIFYYNERWWIFTSDRNDILHLFCAEDLMGPWIEHPKSPVIFRDGNIARSGGRVLILKNKIFRFTQDCEPTYGNQVRAFEITELTLENYSEKEVTENPILKGSGNGWNAEGMHHIDPHIIKENQWLACVDGFVRRWKFGIQY